MYGFAVARKSASVTELPSSLVTENGGASWPSPIPIDGETAPPSDDPAAAVGPRAGAHEITVAAKETVRATKAHRW